ncbi:efflux RND transporter periplasmic adaptor subunit [Pseudooceanicola sp. 502str34]
MPPAPRLPRLLLSSFLVCAPGLAVAQEAGALPVTVVRADFAPVTISATLTGVTEAKDSADMAFRDGGRIVALAVDVGDRVTEGQELGRIDDRQAQEALREAQAQLRAAEANRDRAEQEYTRQGAMYDRGVTTGATLDSARESFRTAVSSVEQARASVEQAQITLDETRLTAPFDGTVTARNADPGQIVGAATAVLELAADRGVVALFYTPEGYVDEAVHAREMSFSLLDEPALPITGTVSEISPMIDPTNGSVAVKVALDAGPAAIPLGAAISGTVLFDIPDTAALPWEALTSDESGPAVWVMGPDGTASLTPVTVERYQTDRVLISDGVTEGAEVVVKGAHLVFPGRALRVVEGE